MSPCTCSIQSILLFGAENVWIESRGISTFMLPLANCARSTESNSTVFTKTIRSVVVLLPRRQVTSSRATSEIVRFTMRRTFPVKRQRTPAHADFSSAKPLGHRQCGCRLRAPHRDDSADADRDEHQRNQPEKQQPQIAPPQRALGGRRRVHVAKCRCAFRITLDRAGSRPGSSRRKCRRCHACRRRLANWATRRDAARPLRRAKRQTPNAQLQTPRLDTTGGAVSGSCSRFDLHPTASLRSPAQGCKPRLLFRPYPVSAIASSACVTRTTSSTVVWPFSTRRQPSERRLSMPSAIA